MSQRETENPAMTPFDGLLKHLADQFATELMSDLGGIEGLLSCVPVGGEVELEHHRERSAMMDRQLKGGRNGLFEGSTGKSNRSL